MEISLSKSERAALEFLLKNDGVLTSTIQDKNEKNHWGDVIPGHSTFRKLEKKGLCFYTEEEPMDAIGDNVDGFVFTNEIYITAEGKAAL